MSETINLASRIEEQLPSELVNFVQTAGKIAASQGQKLYLVGGVVRDLLLGKPNFDLDLVVDGDAIDLTHQLNKIKQGKITVHPYFKTAKLKWDKWSVDLAIARAETYARPGALPSVKPDSLTNDLFRRDFTINAMAIGINPSRYGELIDRHGGKNDLEHKLIRILHDKSFIDDATRIWRGLRYEQRLNFQLEGNTLKLLKHGIPMLDTISGDRIRYELECIFHEEHPEKVLRRAEKLGVLPKLHPALKGDSWLAEKFESARQLTSPTPPPIELYLALLTYRLSDEGNKHLIPYLRLSKPIAKTLKDTANLKAKLKLLNDSELMSSTIYRTLHGNSPSALIANSLASESTIARRHIQLFLDKLRYVKSALTGDSLQRMGIHQGPRIKEILERLHEVKLNGKVSSKQDEEMLVKDWLAHDSKIC